MTDSVDGFADVIEIILTMDATLTIEYIVLSVRQNARGSRGHQNLGHVNPSMLYIVERS